MSFLSLEQIENQLVAQIPKLNKKVTPKEYFQQSAVYLKHAGESKKRGDLEEAYANLRAYIIIIEDLLPSHPDIRKHMDEWKFNNDKVHALKNEIASLVEQMEEANDQNEVDTSRNSQAQQQVQKFVTTQYQNSQSESRAPVVERKPSLFGKKSEEQVLSPEKSPKSGPIMPERRGSTFSKKSEEIGGRMIETVGNNEKVQEKVGSGISKLARNEKVQEKVADNINNTVKDEKFKRGMGEHLAKQTDNEVLKKIYQNEKLQDAVSVSIQKTVGNKELQKKVGNKVAEMAEDKETQKKVAKGLVTVGKGALQGGKILGKGIFNTAKYAYEESRKKDGEQHEEGEDPHE
jgi:hypothetical protein